jgi:hypothetical protein
MTERIKRHLSPGVVLGLIALIVAVGGSSIAIAQQGKKQTLRTRIGGATQLVSQTVTLLPLTTNGGNSDHTITCPSNPKLGPGVALGGGVIDPTGPIDTRNMAPFEEKTDGPAPGNTNAWQFQFDNDTATAAPVQLQVLCTFGKLNTKRG